MHGEKPKKEPRKCDNKEEGTASHDNKAIPQEKLSSFMKTPCLAQMPCKGPTTSQYCIENVSFIGPLRTNDTQPEGKTRASKDTGVITRVTKTLEMATYENPRKNQESLGSLAKHKRKQK